MKKRIIRSIAAVMSAMVLLCGCGELNNMRPIDTIHDLDGRRIGVALAWGPDYILTARDDITPIRYNTVSGMIMALCYKRLDAIAVEMPIGLHILSCVEGLRMVEEPIAVDGTVTYVRRGQEDLLSEFNEFAEDFKHTPEYDDLFSRLYASGEFEPVKVDVVDSTKKLKVAIISDNYPYTYINFETGEFEGSDIEYIKHFANAYGYELEFMDGTYEYMEMGVYYGKMDIAISGISESYRVDVEQTGVYVSQSYMPCDIVLVEIEDPDKLKITTGIEF